MLHVKQRVQYRVIHHLFDVSNLITSIMKQKKIMQKFVLLQSLLQNLSKYNYLYQACL